MSVRVMADVLDSTVGPSRNRFVLLALANNANHGGLCRPGVAHLSGSTAMSRSSVFRALAELEAEGWIERRERTRPNGSRTASGYRIDRAKLQANRREVPADERDELEALFDEELAPPSGPPSQSDTGGQNRAAPPAPPSQSDTGGVSSTDGARLRGTRPTRPALTPPDPLGDPSGEPGGGAASRGPVADPVPEPSSGKSRPPVQCPRHLGLPNPPACRPCQSAREAAEQWDRDQATADVRAVSAAARDRARLRAQEVAACSLCDADGYRGGRVCRHDPDQDGRAERGMNAVREAMAARRKAS